MRIKKPVGLLACLAALNVSAPAEAQIAWNPFTAGGNATVKEAERETSVRSPLSLLNRDSGSAAVATEPSDGPITLETRQSILEEARQYPVTQRDRFLNLFHTLSDAEARQRLEQLRLARLQRQKSPGVAQMSNSPQRPGPAAGYAGTRSGLGSGSPAAGGYSTGNGAPSQLGTSRTAGLGSSNPWDRARAAAQAAESDSARLGSERDAGSFGASAPARSTVIPFSSLRAGTADTASTENVANRPAVEQPQRPTGNAAGLRGTFASYGGGSSSMPQIKPAVNLSENTQYDSNYRPATLSQNGPPSGHLTPQATAPSTYRNPGSLLPATAADLRALIARAEADAAGSTPGQSERELQAHISRHVDLRLLYLVSGQREKALTAIPGVGTEEQVFWTRVFWGLSSYLDAESYPQKRDRATVVLEQLRNAVQSLQGQANLTVRRASFCTDIESFGKYHKFERDEFSPGQEVLVYAELENFQSERTSQGDYRTVLRSAIRVFQAGTPQQVVDEVQYNSTEDRCSSYRRDFMQGFKYRLPQKLKPGPYVLQLTIEDELNGQAANYTLSFTVK